MDDIAQVREKTDLVALISEYVPLKQTGQNFKAPCPFHNEKTPSFVVSPERQIWHCFGCQKGGDCFTFMMEYENMEFPEALRVLATRAGVGLHQGQQQKFIRSEKELLYGINSLAAEFYHYMLTRHKIGKEALSYVTVNRGISEEVLKTFRVGYAPTDKDALVRFLNKKGYKEEELLKTGIAVRRNGKLQDFFIDRLIFALVDHHDNVVGFSGRIFNGSAFGPKYINTKETLIYHKGKHFFGLNVTKSEIRKKQQALIVEGEFDVMSCFQAGISNLVALKGTAFTEDQAQLISRFAKKITLCLDQDSAGQDATRRSLLVLEKHNLIITLIQIPGGKDPDEAARTDIYAFKKAVKEDIPVYDVLLVRALQKYDKDAAEGKKKIAEELLPLFMLITNEIVKEHYFKKLGEAIGISTESIEKELAKLKKKQESPALQKQEMPKKRVKEELLEEYLMALIIQQNLKTSTLETLSSLLKDYEFYISAFVRLLPLLLKAKQSEGFSPAVFAKTLPKEIIVVFDTCYLLPLPVFSNPEAVDHEVLKVAKELKKRYLQSYIKALSEKMRDSEQEDLLIKLQEEMIKLAPLLKSE